MPKVGYWSVKDIEGHAFIERLAAKEGCEVSSIRLNDNRINMDLYYENGKTLISADHSGATVTIETVRPQLEMSRGVSFGDRQMFVNIRFPILQFTHQTTETPVKMTIEEIEKKLGHKVEIASGKE